ncbi:unnamed protein product [Tilletia laevis]|nr:hypothetical protein CF336_g993 [Tilletia laevis]CAD6892514.1 unnamed protein product [Tilletia caries]CAD6961514.1 unnamed protein product [Tilletia laevis]CAD7062320.1 unnamed protein product [Tilletia caries]
MPSTSNNSNQTSASASASAWAASATASPSTQASTPPASPMSEASLLTRAVKAMNLGPSMASPSPAATTSNSSTSTTTTESTNRLTAAALRDWEAKAAASSSGGTGFASTVMGNRFFGGGSSKGEKKDKKDKKKESNAGDDREDTKSVASSTLRDILLNSAPKLSRRGSTASHGGKSDGGKSGKSSKKGSVTGEDGGASRSRVGSQSGGEASLLKKYGVCEKAAIGKGATAVVRLAHKWDRSTERLYAVKEFRKRRKNESEKDYVKKLTSEFCISSTLHHMNVVETVDLVQDENRHWCEVMEYCPGGDLYAAIKRGGMSQGEVECCFKQLVNGIAYLHSMGVAHRDIKPENLLLDAFGHVKITDFGVSDVFRMCWEKNTHYSKGLCGSEPYIAPEQFEQKEYDARLVDVWAAGVVFYCMQFQELPWRVAKMSDPTFKEFVHQYNASPAPSPLSNLSPRDCRPLLKKMLCPDPAGRWQIDEVVRDPWLQKVTVCENNVAPDHRHAIVTTVAS